jgi:hypothetical protein
MGPGDTKSMRKVNDLSLILINFYVPVLTSRLSSTETSPLLSESITLFVVYVIIYRCHQQRNLERHQVFGAYHLYTDCTRTEPCGTPTCISLGVNISLTSETLNFL